eukprot:sb/3475514/
MHPGHHINNHSHPCMMSHRNNNTWRWMNCQSIGLTLFSFRSARELWSEHWPDSTGSTFGKSFVSRPVSNPSQACFDALLQKGIGRAQTAHAQNLTHVGKILTKSCRLTKLGHLPNSEQNIHGCSVG